MSDNSESYSARWQKALIEEHKALFDYKSRTIKAELAEYVTCPVCGSKESDFLFEKDWFRYVKCPNCSMVYMNPRLNQTATKAFYNSPVNEIYNELKFNENSAPSRLDDKINLDNLDIIGHYKTAGNLLEIGSAKGYFLSEAKKRGYKVFGIELNQHNHAISKRLVGDTIRNVDLFEAHFDEEMFDIIYMRDVIEHIADPIPFLREINRISKKGALVFIETHNIEGLIHKIVREKHTVIFGFEHPNHWSPKTLAKALDSCGFQINKIFQVSLDFTIYYILAYFISPTFTSVLLTSENDKPGVLLKTMLKLLQWNSMLWKDLSITPWIANLLGRGSVMKVIAVKHDLAQRMTR
jgi:2-polyprenyl-3-methyl-5-hydroxy-6-metoxy-1,4-benzoquinol methylase/DNA-directed RNA polymerase subunit RPC12/RpoP